MQDALIQLPDHEIELLLKTLQKQIRAENCQQIFEKSAFISKFLVERGNPRVTIRMAQMSLLALDCATTVLHEEV